MFKFGILLLLAGVAVAARRRLKVSRAEPDGEVYAVLVAGSNGWYNYRHQADVAHAYHVLLNHGLPRENIIVMMYDDIANNRANPHKGALYNRPHGENLYKGLNIDYKAEDVTPDNFINVLKGNASGIRGGNGRVIDSTKNDRIFVYFTDHGATGLIAFPSDMLTVKTLNQELKWMYENERFAQLVFYLEACESGSMFEKVLEENINIYAITAANSHESSWGTYCENDMGLPCLGDLFSVNWMDDSDEEDLNTETLSQQFDIVKRKTNLSHVMHFGDLSIAKEPVGWFQGEKQGFADIKKIGEKQPPSANWPSRDIELMELHKQKEHASSKAEQKLIMTKIMKLHEERREAKLLIHAIVDRLLFTREERHRMFEARTPVFDVHCHHTVTTVFDEECIDFNMYPDAMKYAFVLNNLCSVFDTETIVEEMRIACENSYFM